MLWGTEYIFPPNMAGHLKNNDANGYRAYISVYMRTLLTLMAFFLSARVGRVLLLHSFRSRATSWVAPTPFMSSLLLVPCLLGTSSSSGTWYCQLHHSAGDSAGADPERVV